MSVSLLHVITISISQGSRLNFSVLPDVRALYLKRTDSTNKSTSVPQGNKTMNFTTREQKVTSLESCCFFFLFIWYSDLTPTPPHQGPQCVIV